MKMDGGNVDSDHSMTWEDFFGSTTELTPTLIGIYDSFLEPKKCSKKEVSSEVTAKDARNVPPLPPPRKTEQAHTMIAHTIDEENTSKDPKTPGSSTNVVNNSSLYQLRTKVGGDSDNKTTAFVNQRVETKTSDVVFGNLSSNVKRMISTADTSSSPLKFQKKSMTSVRTSGRRSNIPLVGATSKIAQSRVEILPSVEIYDQPCAITSKKNTEESPTKKLKPDFEIDAQDTYDVPTNNKPVTYDVPNSKTAFESLSLPFIDQSIELSNADREFDTKISSKNTTPVDAQTSATEPNNLKGAKLSPNTNSLTRKESPAKQLPKSEPYPQEIGSTGNLKADPEKETKLNPPSVEVSRPLSMSSIVSSSSSSSGVQNKGVNSAYLASIESLDDHSDDLTSANGSSNYVNDAGVLKEGLPRSEYLPRGPEELSGLSQLERVCAEIIHTENVYVQDLQQVVEGYLHVWKKDMVFSEEDLGELFNNIEDIYHFNSSFCSQLNTCKLDATCIARCFVSFTGGFGVYTSYCTGYPRTMERLAALAPKPQFRERQIALGHPLPLASYLLKPVQRILKYHLLLQNVVKQCSSRETEYALAQMTAIAHHIDDMKRRHEHAVRVQEIQSLLYGWNGPDLTTYGELCAEGTFRVLGARGMRHVFLFDKMLLITKNREDGILAYKTHIMCNNMMLVESISGAALSFHVIPWDRPRSLTTLHSPTHAHKRQWTLLLKRVILENYNAVIPSHARQLVMELGQNRTDDDMIAEKSHNLITQASMRKQLSAPEYLQKRKLERERRKSFENEARARKKKTLTLPSKSDLTSCDCAQVSAEKGVDYTCDYCYIDLCSDCEEKDDKCGVCDRNLIGNASSVENLDRKDYLSSQESFNIGKSGYLSDGNKVMSASSMTDVSYKTCLKCSVKENHDSRSRCLDVDRRKVDSLRSKSKDDPQRSKLSRIGTWRRKSEPNRQQVALAAKRTQDKVVGSEKCEFLCRNCGSNKINRDKSEEGIMSDPEIEHRKAKNLDIKMYNTKNVPKKISKLKKNRAKAKFYADLTKEKFTDNVLHITESNDSLNVDLANDTSGKTLTTQISKDEDIDEETYKKLIEKTDSFKKNELEKVKYLNQQKVINEVSNAEIERMEDDATTQVIEETEQPLEHIISQLLMQNREFQKLLKKQQLRNINNKRHGVLLKSHSYPEQSPKSPTRKKSDASIRELSPAKELDATDEDHIYETLRVEPKVKTPPVTKRKPEQKLTQESDYVYLSFDKLNDDSEGIYDVPIKSPEKMQSKDQDYYVTMEKGPSPAKKKENVYDMVFVNRDGKKNEGTYLSMSPEHNASRSPNTPETWLSDQKEHFNVPRDRKSGSLPRSFQVNNVEENLSTFKCKTYLNREGKVINSERPYTIASDQGEIGYESVENYISEENIKFNKMSLKHDDVQNVSQSTLELEEEIDRCYKNNFETVNLSIKTDKLDVSEANLDVSITSSCEGLPPNRIDNENKDVEVIHPEHKIYKATGNVLSLKNVLSRFKNRNLDKSLEDTTEANNGSEQSSPEKDCKVSANEKRSALNPRSYSKNLLQRFRSIIGDEHEDFNGAVIKSKKTDDNVKSDVKVVITSTDVSLTTSVYTDALSKSVCEQTTLTESQSEKSNLDILSQSCNDITQKDVSPKYERSLSVTYSSFKKTNNSQQNLKLPVYMQGSKHLGARIAQSDYLDPKTLKEKSDLKHVNVLINRNSVRPDSLFSNTSFVTTSSEGSERTTETVSKTNDTLRRGTVVSDENFYEKSFEKIENLTEDDVFRDSAVYSDHDDEVDSKNGDKNVKTTVDAVNRNASVKMEHVTVRHSVSDIKTKMQTRIMLTSRVSEVKTQSNVPAKPKTAPPLPVKPKITHLPTATGFSSKIALKNTAKPDLANKNANVKRNTSLIYTKTENFNVKHESADRTNDNAPFKRQTFERASLDSVVRKSKPKIEGQTTKSVLERRMEIESLTKSHLKAQTLTKKPSHIARPKSITAKVTPYERSSTDVTKNEKPSTSDRTEYVINDDIKTEGEKGSWVKTVVNKFQ